MTAVLVQMVLEYVEIDGTPALEGWCIDHGFRRMVELRQRGIQVDYGLHRAPDGVSYAVHVAQEWGIEPYCSGCLDT